MRLETFSMSGSGVEPPCAGTSWCMTWSPSSRIFPSLQDMDGERVMRPHEHRIAVITGTTHGIGVVTSRELVKKSLTVVMLCRDLEAAGRVRAEIVGLVSGAQVHC